MRNINWICKNKCQPPNSGTVLFDDGTMFADGCCGGDCVIVEINYCPVCGLKVSIN